MLSINIQAAELWDPVREEFLRLAPQTLRLEHSLFAISKWEAKWHKPFLTNDAKTGEELADYIRCMTIPEPAAPEIYLFLKQEDISLIQSYIEDSMTATWFSGNQTNKRSREVVTSELIYYWMIRFGIPFTCETWHLNRLLTLIRVCNEKETPPKKMSQRQLMSRNKALNELRRKQMHSKG